MPTKYDQIIVAVFERRFSDDGTGFIFLRSDIPAAAAQLQLAPPSNYGDVVYTYRSRRDLPAAINDRAPPGMEWVILTEGRGRYRFRLFDKSAFAPSPQLAKTLIPDSTPALIQMYRQSDEQALLAIIRYNRLIDIFTRLSCYSVQSHLRTSVRGIGQIEIDELYVGIDRRGAHYILPIEVKAASDKLAIPQIQNMLALAADRFPSLIARPVGAQFVDEDVIALFEFEAGAPGEGPVVVSERQYRLVPAEELPPEVVESYGSRLDE